MMISLNSEIVDEKYDDSKILSSNKIAVCSDVIVSFPDNVSFFFVMFFQVIISFN